MTNFGANEVERACETLRETLTETRGLSRREFILALGSTAAGAMLLGASAGFSYAQTPPVTVFLTGGSFKRGFITAFGDPFNAKTGVPVRYQDPFVFARVRAMFIAKAMEIDVTSSQGREFNVAVQTGMATPLDFNLIDRSVMTPTQIKNDLGIGGFTITFAVCYSTKKWPADSGPKSWADFWNVEKFPGRRSLRNNEAFTLECALLADGVKSSEMYPLDMDRAFRALDRIKPHVKVWWDQPSQAQQIMLQDEVDLIAVIDSSLNEVVSNGAPFAAVWDQAIGTGNGQTWFVPVGAPNPSGGMKMLDFLGRAEPQAAFARLNYSAPQNLKAYEYLDEAIGKRFGTHPEHLAKAHVQNHTWWADNYEEAARRFQRWLRI